MKTPTAKFVITCAGRAMQLGCDGYLYILVHDPISVFRERRAARNAIRRSIRERIQKGFNDEFSKSQCYKIHKMVIV